MIRSMTGFGQGSAETDGVTVWAEVSSLNHRYLDISLKLSSPFFPFETELRKFIQGFFERGRINVFLASEGTLPEANEVEFNRHLARQYLDQVRAFGSECGLRDDVDLTALLRLNPLWTAKRPHPEEIGKLVDSAKQALTAAIEQLTAMRTREGASIWSDLSQKIEQIQAITKVITERAPAVIEEYRQKLRERIEALLPQGVVFDEQRLLSEVAMLGERADINEELSRMASHIEQFHVLAREQNNVGRRLDFLLQEMFREVTTIGSKARDAAISHAVVETKGLLEKMREQVQNVE